MRAFNISRVCSLPSAKSPLSESQRLEYLKALGIESYFPRMQLPGAPESSLVILEDPAETIQETAPVSESVPAKLILKAAPLSGEPATPISAKEEHVDTPAPATGVKHRAREEIRLQLLCIRAGSNLAILNALPHLGPGQLSARHKTLLTSLLAALGIPAEDMEVESKPFTWPMVTGLHVDNSARAAAIALLAYLQQKQSDWSFGRLLVMGENALQPVFITSEEDKDSSAGPSLDHGKWKFALTRSLDELLQHPELKKESWMRIRTLFS
jgi:hypothetical protein